MNWICSISSQISPTGERSGKLVRDGSNSGVLLTVKRLQRLGFAMNKKEMMMMTKKKKVIVESNVVANSNTYSPFPFSFPQRESEECEQRFKDESL